jgi:nicotinate-nucleotide pyrophosphorylase (carboxylating)
VSLRRAVAEALDEDLGDRGDITTQALIPEGTACEGSIIARSALVLAGTPVVRETFSELARRGYREIEIEPRAGEGERLEPGDVALVLEGDAAAILAGERTALNFLQRLSGIATLVRACLSEVASTGATILDTRKTTPGLRALEKYAVLVGGGTNHRLGLFDRVLIKDNHIALAGEGGVGDAVRRAIEAGHPGERVEVEVEDPGDVDEAVRAGAGWILLDNLDPDGLRRAVALCGGRARLEASGGLRPGDLRRFAETGVDALSLGALTHSAPAADLSLEVTPVGAARRD